MNSLSKFIFWLFIIISCSCSPLSTYGSSDLFRTKHLVVPVSEFLSSLKSTINTIQNVTSIVSGFANVSNDFRLSNAISGCLDLLDLSAEVLDWTYSASQKSHDNHYGTGKLDSDFRTWLNAVLVNQDTCLEGFDGTKERRVLKSLMEAKFNQITSSIPNILDMLHPTPHSKPKGAGDRKLISPDEFPSWLKHEQKEVIQATNGPDLVDVVVAEDGTGKFTSINDAINYAPEFSSKRFVIHIKKGVYKEYVSIGKNKWNIMLIGDGMDATVISGNRNYVDGWETYQSATVSVMGRGFIARDITFENTAGPEKHQAVAFFSESDLSVLYKCAFRGYQDTLCANNMRQFYKNCLITGTVDFIFGYGTAVFQNCQILARKGLEYNENTITANGRSNSRDGSGFSIQFSNISAEPEVLASQGRIETYLGRPWKLYSRTVIMHSYISNAIHPKGWLEWSGNYALDTLYFGEYMNFGPGANLDNRVHWPGFHKIKDPNEAKKFTVDQLISGYLWLPKTGISYIHGLDS